MARIAFDYRIHGRTFQEEELTNIAIMSSGLCKVMSSMRNGGIDMTVHVSYESGFGVNYYVTLNGKDIGEATGRLFEEAGIPRFVMNASSSRLYSDVEEILMPYGKTLERSWRTMFFGRRVIDL